MAKKDTFLLVSLNEEKAKEVAQIITNNTCRKMLDFLASTMDATESQIATALDIPISTVHYNLEALKKAKLIESEEFHYSSKGKEVSHYKLANKYIIIAPQSTHGIKDKLRSILPLGLLAAATGFFINLFSKGTFKAAELARGGSYNMVVQDAAEGSAGTVVTESLQAAPNAVDKAVELGRGALSQPTIWQNPVFWFITGVVFAIVLYLFIEYLRKRGK